MRRILSSSVASLADTPVKSDWTRMPKILALSIGLTIAATAPAADQNYDPANAANVWDLATLNWDLSTAAWVNNNNAIFGGLGESVTVNGAPIIVDNITFNSSGYTLANGTGTLSLSTDLASTITIAAGTATIAETIADNAGGTSALTKAGAGALVLSGSNTFTGATTLSAGTLIITNANALGSSTAGTVQTGASELRLSGGITTAAEPLSIVGGGIANAGALRNFADNNTYAGTVTLTGQTRIVADNGTLTLNAAPAITGTNQNLVISGAGNIVVTGAVTTGTGFISKDAFIGGGTGALTLAGSNTYTGATTAAAGTLRLDYSTNDNSKLSETGVFTLGGLTAVPGIPTFNTGAIVELIGGAHPEVVGSTTLANNTVASTITRSSGGAVLHLNTVTPNTGTGLIFTAPNIATTDNAVTNGLLGFWARMNVGGVSSWATSAGTADSPVTAFTAYTDVNRLGGVLPNGATNNLRIINGGASGNITLGGGALTQAYTLQMSAAAGSATIAPAASTNVLNIGDNTGGAIWVTPNSGALNIGTSGGNGILTSGAGADGVAAQLRLVNDSTNNTVVNSVIADNGTDVVSFTKSGPGTVILNTNNTFTGPLTVAGGGSLVLTGNNSARPNGVSNSIVIFGTLQAQANAGNTTGSVSTVLMNEQTANQPLIISNGGTLQLRSDSSVTFAGGNNFGGLGTASVTIDVNGAGVNQTLTLAPGGFNVSNTVIHVTGGNNGYTLNLGNINNVTGAANNTMTLNPTTASVRVAGYTGSTAFTSTLILSGTSTGSMVTGPVSNTSTGAVVSLTKTGPGIWDLQGANTYTGTTTVREGVLVFSGNRTAASGVIAIGDTAGLTATLFQTGGSFAMTSTQMIIGNSAVGATGTYSISGGTLTGAAATNRGIILGTNGGTTGTVNLSGTGNLDLGSAAVQVGRSDSATTNSTGIFNQTGGTATIGTLTVGGGVGAPYAGTTGTLNLTGGTFAATNFTLLAAAQDSNTTITIGGTAQVTLPAFPTARGAGAVATLNFDGGTLIPAAASATYLEGFTNAFLTANGAKFDVSSGNDITVGQVLRNATGQTGTFTKLGAGALTLSGANTYTGTTTVSAGSLLVSGSLAGATTVSSGATLGGSGTVGALTVANGGSVAPGIDIGTLSTGALSLGSNSTLRFDLTAPGVVGGATNDLLSVTGALTLDGTLQVTELAGFGNGTYRLANYTGALTNNVLVLESTFLAAHPGSSINVATPNQVNLIVIPEPGSAAVLLGGIAGLLGLRRRRGSV